MPKNLTDLKGETIVLDAPANVKVKGEKAMRKGVTLKANEDGESVRVLTGKRGRPGSLRVEQIESTRALPVKAEKPKKPAKKAAAKKPEPANA